MRDRVYNNSHKVEAVHLGVEEKVGGLNYLAVSGNPVLEKSKDALEGLEFKKDQEKFAHKVQ